jgi:hypothetical protein
VNTQDALLTSVRRSLPEGQLKTLTLWSPCVEANARPSGEKATAMVDFAVLSPMSFRVRLKQFSEYVLRTTYPAISTY